MCGKGRWPARADTPRVSFPRLFLAICWSSHLNLLAYYGPSPLLVIGQQSPTLHAETFDIPKIFVNIDCIAAKLMPTSLAKLHRSRFLSHITKVCTTLIFSSASLGRPYNPSSTMLSLALCCPIFFCATSRRLLPKGFHDVFMNVLGRYSFLTEVLNNRSDLSFSISQMCPTLLP